MFGHGEKIKSNKKVLKNTLNAIYTFIHIYNIYFHTRTALDKKIEML